jgi:DNA-binding GntR family transcriptional regulator
VYTVYRIRQPACEVYLSARKSKPPLQPVERSASLGDRVYDLLRDHLRSGRVSWGEPLREAALAGRLGVSRTPVREALARLVSEGLIEAHGRSFTVPSLTREDLDDIYDLRLLLETEAVRQAAARRDGASGIAEVRRALQQAKAAHLRGDAEAFIAANSRFRSAWLGMVRNGRLVRTVLFYADHVRALGLLTLGDRQRQKMVLRGMSDILGALERHDPSGAVAAMRRYLGISRSAMLQAAGRLSAAAKVA